MTTKVIVGPHSSAVQQYCRDNRLRFGIDAVDAGTDALRGMSPSREEVIYLPGWETAQNAEQTQAYLEMAIAIRERRDTKLPHSRACGIHKHDHGSDCHPTCPTCGGK